ncbi:hypothetical protein WN943_009538 [Citrus x changshan-huyou]
MRRHGESDTAGSGPPNLNVEASAFRESICVAEVAIISHESVGRLEHTSTATQDFEAKDGDSSTNFTNVVVEDSAREVPTGPDPLHHNNNPAGP